MRKFIQEPEGHELDVNDLRSLGLTNYSHFDTICAGLAAFKAMGKKAYFIFNGCLLKSEDVEKYTSIDYVYENCFMYKRVLPITSIEEFANEVSNLGDWRDPRNQEEYCKIMFQFVKMYHGYRFNIELEEGIDGKFKGNYPREYVAKLREIIEKKFPPIEIFFENHRLKPEFGGIDQDFYVYLGNFDAGRGTSLLAERTAFEDDAFKSGFVYNDDDVNLDTIRSMVQQARSNSNTNGL